MRRKRGLQTDSEPVDGSPELLRASLLAWYDRVRRSLPWRALPGEVADPYLVWVSEVMLQQTTVAVAAPYFQAFVARWPTVADLAAADLDDVLHAWQGLGYYARARNLLHCARLIASAHGGRFPSSETDLRRLPGIGSYTAAAIAAIAFNQGTVPVDGNVLRVISRLYAVDAPLPAARGEIAARAGGLASTCRPGDFAQAVMDLGATVCVPKRPLCIVCPWQGWCAALRRDGPEAYPRRTPKEAKASRYGAAFWAERSDGAVLLRRRPDDGLLGGLMEFPSTLWRGVMWKAAEAAEAAPFSAEWVPLTGIVKHTFTHFNLELSVLASRDIPDPALNSGKWCSPEDFHRLAMSTLMKKVVHFVTTASLLPFASIPP
jgi:A/G-specific adenine glycosylase